MATRYTVKVEAVVEVEAENWEAATKKMSEADIWQNVWPLEILEVIEVMEATETQKHFECAGCAFHVGDAYYGHDGYVCEQCYEDAEIPGERSHWTQG